MEKSKTVRRLNRASVACTTCRQRRVKCVKAPGQRICDKCQLANLDCKIPRDERRTPISRVELKSLRERVQLLEGLLQENTSPPSNSSRPSQLGLLEPNEVECRQYQASSYADSPIILDQAADPVRFFDSPKGIYSNSSRNNASFTRTLTSSADFSMSDGPRKALLERLLSTSSNLTFNPSSRRVDYFGPTRDFYLDSENTSVGSPEQDKRAERVLRDLSPSVHDHLMDTFWQFYKPFTCFIDKEAFNEDMNNGGTQSYSRFLHVCVLAMGVRYADIKRPEIVKISLPNRESVLHREAKYLAEFELEKPGAEPSVQALLILSALESGCGRDTIGWMYAGMAFRMAFDLGLNLDGANLHLSQREQQIRRNVLSTCVIFDRYWSMYLGRPTSIKISDLSISSLMNHQSQGSGRDQRDLETQICGPLLNLMGLTSKITGYVYPMQSPADYSAYVTMAGLDDELKAWYDTLAASLSWDPSKAQAAPPLFFHLHQQYHTSIILLHRPFAFFEESESESGTDHNRTTSSRTLSSISRNICVDHAIRLTAVLMHHRERFDPRRIPQPTLLHIGTAAGALILGIALSTDPRERAVASRCLFSLAELVHAMSPTYRPAELMSNMLDNVLKEPWWEFNSAPNLEKSVAPRIPPRREESDNDRFGLSFQPQPGNPDMFLDVDQPINGLDIEFCSPPVSPPTGMGSPLQQINGADVPRHQIAFNSMYYWDMSDLDQAAASSNFLTETIGG